MADTLRAGEQGDLISAQRALGELELLAPSDPAVQRLRREVEAQVKTMRGAATELRVESKLEEAKPAVHPGFVPVEIPGATKRPEPADYTARRVGFVSTRGHVGTGDRVLTVNFSIEPPEPRLVLVRGVGPSLRTETRKRGYLAEPRIELMDSNNRLVGTNSDWRKSGDPAFIAAMVEAGGGVAFNADGQDAAIVATLDPGRYLVRLGSVRDRTGIGVIEIYQFAP